MTRNPEQESRTGVQKRNSEKESKTKEGTSKQEHRTGIQKRNPKKEFRKREHRKGIQKGNPERN